MNCEIEFMYYIVIDIYYKMLVKTDHLQTYICRETYTHIPVGISIKINIVIHSI